MIAIQYYDVGGSTMEWVAAVSPVELRVLEEEFDFYNAWKDNILIKGLAPRDSYDLGIFHTKKKLFLADVFEDTANSDMIDVDDGLSIFSDKETIQEFLDVEDFSDPSELLDIIEAPWVLGEYLRYGVKAGPMLRTLIEENRFL